MTVVSVLLTGTHRSALYYTLTNRTDRNLLSCYVRFRWFTVARRRDSFNISSMTIKKIYIEGKSCTVFEVLIKNVVNC